MRNDAKDLASSIITSEQEFLKYFGYATIMGDSGKPTPIDFSKQYVIAVTRPENWYLMSLLPVSLVKRGDGLLKFTYKTTEKDEKQTFSINPFLLVIVDKKYGENVLLLN